MLTEEQYLLITLSEECDEVGQRVSKALRFGLYETQPGHPLDNAARITQELTDIWTLVDELVQRGVIDPPLVCEAKRERVFKMMAYSREQGTLEPTPVQYRHVQRGSEYREVGRAKVQASTRPIVEGDEMVIYRPATNNPQLFARRDDEFFDGRFERVE